MIYFQKTKAKGFSLIELLLSICILFLLFTFVNNGFLKQQRNMEFEVVVDNLYNQLYEAREHSRNFKDGNVYGVYFETDKYIGFKGTTYNSTGVIATYNLPAFLQITNLSLNGVGNEIIFEKNTGKTNNYGNLNLVSDNGLKLNLQITNQGTINKTYIEN